MVDTSWVIVYMLLAFVVGLILGLRLMGTMSR